MNDLYGPPLSLQDLCDNVFKYANNHYLKKTELLGWGMQVKFTERASNTHSAPHNGQQNWHWSDDKPKGYPGWHGRVWIFYNKQVDWCDENLFPNLRLYTGTGGYGMYDCRFCTYKTWDSQEVYPLSYDFRFYQADWPSLILGDVFGEDNKEKTLVYRLKR
jgi:hypothetical protein